MSDGLKLQCITIETFSSYACFMLRTKKMNLFLLKNTKNTSAEKLQRFELHSAGLYRYNFFTSRITERNGNHT